MKKLLTLFLFFATISFGRSQCDKCFELLNSDPKKPNTCVLKVQFVFDKAQYRPEFQPEIDSLAILLNTYRTFVIEVGNHRDSRGSDEYSRDITLIRARAVVDSLVARGISKERLIAKGYGETSPRELEKDYTGTSSGYVFTKGTKLTDDYINSLDTKNKIEDAHQLNRRTEIKIIAIR